MLCLTSQACFHFVLPLISLGINLSFSLSLPCNAREFGLVWPGVILNSLKPKKVRLILEGKMQKPTSQNRCKMHSCLICFLFLFTEDWYPQGKQNVLPGTTRKAMVPGLRPWTVYHLRVFAENQLGKSKEGKTLQVNMLFVCLS